MASSGLTRDRRGPGPTSPAPPAARRRAGLLGLALAAVSLGLATWLIRLALVLAEEAVLPSGSLEVVSAVHALLALAAGCVTAWAGLVLVLAALEHMRSTPRDAGQSAVCSTHRGVVTSAAGFLLVLSLGSGTSAGAASAPAPVVPVATVCAEASVATDPAEDLPPGRVLCREPAPVAAPVTTTSVRVPATGATTPRSASTESPPAHPVPGWTPTRPAQSALQRSAWDLVTRPPHPAPAAVGEPERVVDQVVVHRGDTLWELAAAHLGRDADSDAIAAEWPRWYDANREVIGSDPDLLLPGQVLTVPADPARDTARVPGEPGSGGSP